LQGKNLTFPFDFTVIKNPDELVYNKASTENEFRLVAAVMLRYWMSAV